MLRFLYLNIYAFVLVFSGALVLLIPLYLISKWFWIPQGIIALLLFSFGSKLFMVWEDKKIKREILVKKNKEEFRHDTFEVFMQAPCGRLIVRSVLAEIGKKSEYKNLLHMKKPLLTTMKESCTPVRTTVYINEEYAASKSLS